jgi:hypothetical protein
MMINHYQCLQVACLFYHQYSLSSSETEVDFDIRDKKLNFIN